MQLKTKKAETPASFDWLFGLLYGKLPLVLLLLFSTASYAQVKMGNDIDGEAAGDQSGCSLSLSPSGNRIAIGAIFNDGTGPDAGHARVYSLTPAALPVEWLYFKGEVQKEGSHCKLAPRRVSGACAFCRWHYGRDNASGKIVP